MILRHRHDNLVKIKKLQIIKLCNLRKIIRRIKLARQLSHLLSIPSPMLVAPLLSILSNLKQA